MSEIKKCAKCHQLKSGNGITARNNYFHDKCFTCSACNKQLGTSQYYFQEGAYFCVTDYQKKFGVKCHVCHLYLEDKYQIVGGNNYHYHCFTCADCNTSLVDLPFYTKDGAHYCVQDYQKRWGKKCFVCHEFIQRTFLTVKNQSYHFECFKCSWCDIIFPRDSQYYLGGNSNEFICQKCEELKQESTKGVPFSTIGAPTAPPSPQRPKCYQCKKIVYPLEEFKMMEKVYHKTCFQNSSGRVKRAAPQPPGHVAKSSGNQNIQSMVENLTKNLSRSPSTSKSSTSDVSAPNSPTVPKTPEGAVHKLKSQFELNGLFKPKILPKPTSTFSMEGERTSLEASPGPSTTKSSTSSTGSQPPSTRSSHKSEGEGEECAICCENKVDSVFIPCGHMCACFKCATEYSEGNPNATCPICRNPSTGVYKTFSS